MLNALCVLVAISLLGRINRKSCRLLSPRCAFDITESRTFSFIVFGTSRREMNVRRTRTGCRRFGRRRGSGRTVFPDEREGCLFLAPSVGGAVVVENNPLGEPQCWQVRCANPAERDLPRFVQKNFSW